MGCGDDFGSHQPLHYLPAIPRLPKVYDRGKEMTAGSHIHQVGDLRSCLGRVEDPDRAELLRQGIRVGLPMFSAAWTAASVMG
jgi:hypothetical protein